MKLRIPPLHSGTFRLVRDPSSTSVTSPLDPFQGGLSDEEVGLDWQGGAIEGTYWGDILLAAKSKGLVVVPNVDACTAWCAVGSKLRVVPMKEPMNHKQRQRLARWSNPVLTSALLLPEVRKGSLVPSSMLWAFHTSVDFARKYMSPYFDLLAKNEVPDMSLLEWLVTMGGIEPSIARAAVARYSKKRRGDSSLLHEQDRTRLLAAAEARESAVAAEANEPTNTAVVSP